MISVQSVYAGMERFGVDVGLASPPNHRRGSSLTDKHHHHHHRHHCHRCSDEIIRCPHHVSLPDGEWNQSYSNSQFRNSYQQAEITRTYIRAPPNKSALEINLPVQKLNMSVSLKSMHKDKLNSPTQDLNTPIAMSTSANSVPATVHNNSSSNTNNNNNTNNSNNTNTNNKSKHNPIAKFFTRISSVPTNNAGAVAAAAYQTAKSPQLLCTDNNHHHQQTSPLSASLVCVSTTTSLSLLETTECPQTS